MILISAYPRGARVWLVIVPLFVIALPGCGNQRLAEEDAVVDEARDWDGDGLTDQQDQCPAQAEDLDGLADDDGCPEQDYDGDGFPDEEDDCPRMSLEVAEDFMIGCPQLYSQGCQAFLPAQEFDPGVAHTAPVTTRFAEFIEIWSIAPHTPSSGTVVVEGWASSGESPTGDDLHLACDRARAHQHALEGEGISVARWKLFGIAGGKTWPIAKVSPPCDDDRARWRVSCDDL